MSYNRINIIKRLQDWMDSESGQTFLNYAYSWGAAIVILGTLFKLTHIQGADAMLFLGMGAEVFVFLVSAFDRPFDKVGRKETICNETDEQQDDSLEVPELEKLIRKVGMAPDGEETKLMKEVVKDIYEAYKHQLAKVHAQLKEIDQMSEQMRIQTAYMSELNKIYGRMIDAVKVKDE